VHLYNPRIVVKESIMPAYTWLFMVKETPDKRDIVVNVPSQYMEGVQGKIVATVEAMQLIAYLQSLKQTKLPDGSQSSAFLYKSVEETKTGAAAGELDGKMIYTTNCQSCHQANGEGLKGAFPPLKGSPIVLGDNLEKYIDIIMHGYDARAEYGVMPPVGTNMNFTEKEMSALINYERSSWGNSGKKVTPEEVKKVMDFVKLKVAQ
jgi:cytochrome c oxidase cbb3-type subunit 2